MALISVSNVSIHVSQFCNHTLIAFSALSGQVVTVYIEVGLGYLCKI